MKTVIKLFKQFAIFLAVLSSLTMVSCHDGELEKSEIKVPDWKDEYVGNYTCMVLFTYVTAGGPGIHYETDTTETAAYAQISVAGDSSLNVTPQGWPTFEATYTSPGKFTCLTCNGPPHYVRFYSTDSIYIYLKSGVSNSTNFRGRKL